MKLFIATILVSVAIAAYLTALVCRRSISQGRRPSFWPAPVAALIGPVIIILASEGRELFTHQYWQDRSMGKPLPYLVLFVCICVIASIIPAIAVVTLYRRKVKC